MMYAFIRKLSASSISEYMLFLGLLTLGFFTGGCPSWPYPELRAIAYWSGPSEVMVSPVGDVALIIRDYSHVWNKRPHRNIPGDPMSTGIQDIVLSMDAPAVQKHLQALVLKSGLKEGGVYFFYVNPEAIEDGGWRLLSQSEMVGSKWTSPTDEIARYYPSKEVGGVGLPYIVDGISIRVYFDANVSKLSSGFRVWD